MHLNLTSTQKLCIGASFTQKLTMLGASFTQNRDQSIALDMKFDLSTSFTQNIHFCASFTQNLCLGAKYCT